MIKISGNDIFRDGTKIGWVTGDHIFNHMGEKVGYVVSDMVYDESSKKLAHLEGEFVYYPDSDKSVRLEDVIAGIDSPSLSNIQRIAVRIFFGN